MSNRAFGDSRDILLGAGELYISVDGDNSGWKNLGNVEDFTITADITDIEKHSSFNKKRELQAIVTTQLQVTASATLSEYDPVNLALALYGDTTTHKQTGRIVTDQVYSAPAAPGIITVIDENGDRYYNISDVSVRPQGSLQSGVWWEDAKSFGDISTVDNKDDTITVNGMGGTITIELNGAIIVNQSRIYVTIIKSPKAPGDLDEMEVAVVDSGSGSTLFKTFTSCLSDFIELSNGIKITFTVTGSQTFQAMSPVPTDGVVAVACPVSDSYIEDVDYIATRQSCSAGMIKIPAQSRIREGDIVLVSCIVPDKNFLSVNTGVLEAIDCKLLYVADNNSGGNYVIEIWKARLEPKDGLGSLIGEDFANFNLEFKVITDYESHPGSPYFSATFVGYPGEESDSSTYNSEY